MGREHCYHVAMTWTGSAGVGTTTYASYERSYVLTSGIKAAIEGSSDPQFRGDATRWNPEELLLASLSACHQLWYLHLCAAAKVTVLAYEDSATGTMTENSDGSGQFTAVVLRPTVTIAAQSDTQRARDLHREASRMCFIARSVTFPVEHAPTISVQEGEQPSPDTGG